jgi:hypothetical protein
MSVPSIPQDITADDFFPPGAVPVVSDLADGTRPAQLFELPHIHLTDPRLQGFRVKLLLSDPLTTDVPDTLCTLKETGQQWRLWRIWLRRPHVPLLGELRYEIGWGWVEVTYHPTWTGRRATPEECAELSRGLAYLQQVIPRQGHPVGTGRSFASREEFVQDLRQAKRRIRQRHGQLKKRLVSHEMGISPMTFYAYLRRFPGSWEEA